MNFRSTPQPMSSYEAISIGLTSVFCAVAMLLMYNYCKLINKRMDDGETMTEAVLFATIDSTPVFGSFVKWLSCVFDESVLPQSNKDIKPAAISLKKVIIQEDNTIPSSGRDTRADASDTDMFYFGDIPPV